MPEGGTNELAVKGCEEILTEADNYFDYVSCAMGTGGTISGIINSSKQGQQILGFPALKGSFLKEDISIRNPQQITTDCYYLEAITKQIAEKAYNFICLWRHDKELGNWAAWRANLQMKRR